jgi:hypothetical protein
MQEQSLFAHQVLDLFASFFVFFYAARAQDCYSNDVHHLQRPSGWAVAEEPPIPQTLPLPTLA